MFSEKRSNFFHPEDGETASLSTLPFDLGLWPGGRSGGFAVLFEAFQAIGVLARSGNGFLRSAEANGAVTLQRQTTLFGRSEIVPSFDKGQRRSVLLFRAVDIDSSRHYIACLFSYTKSATQVFSLCLFNPEIIPARFDAYDCLKYFRNPAQLYYSNK
jgi:hypothetical protein